MSSTIIITCILIITILDYYMSEYNYTRKVKYLEQQGYVKTTKIMKFSNQVIVIYKKFSKEISDDTLKQISLSKLKEKYK